MYTKITSEYMTYTCIYVYKLYVYIKSIDYNNII